MARYNKIFAGPVTQRTPQVQERTSAAALKPGSIVTEVAGLFVQAGANAPGKLYVVQDNYLAMEGPDTDWAIGDTVIGMEPLDELFFHALVATGQNLARGAALTTNATGRLVASGAGQRVAFVSEEAYNNNTGSDQLVRVRRAAAGMNPAP